MHNEDTGTSELSLPKLVLNASVELVWPTRCAGCEQRGELLCNTCNTALLTIEQKDACGICGAPFGKFICTECYSAEGKQQPVFSHAVAAVEMDELSGRLVVLYKDHDEHRLGALFAEKIKQHIPFTWLSWIQVVTWIPADKKALRRRGFDHMESVARELSAGIGVPYQRFLTKSTCRDQRGLSREQRRLNLQESFSLIESQKLKGLQVLVLDDVHTTGATLDAAADVLLQGGAKEVRAASFARVW